ncbi:MAG: DUF1697 domain-containing protein [Actinomycetota bacterium]|nr:DUF1697 domain-containing protein [Actinomycetota bacterium]
MVQRNWHPRQLSIPPCLPRRAPALDGGRQMAPRVLGHDGGVAQTWVALLRGINVGGHRRVPMATLRTAYAQVGCLSVATYIQSGNVVLDHSEADPAVLATMLEEVVLQACGVDARVVLRRADQWTAMVDANPFVDLDPAFLNVTFLADAPDPALVADVEGRDLGADRVRVVASHLYAWLPDGVLGARLSGAQVERLLGAGTARNWRTVVKITDLIAARAL